MKIHLAESLKEFIEDKLEAKDALVEHERITGILRMAAFWQKLCTPSSEWLLPVWFGSIIFSMIIAMASNNPFPLMAITFPVVFLMPYALYAFRIWQFKKEVVKSVISNQSLFSRGYTTIFSNGECSYNAYKMFGPTKEQHMTRAFTWARSGGLAAKMRAGSWKNSDKWLPVDMGRLGPDGSLFACAISAEVHRRMDKDCILPSDQYLPLLFIQTLPDGSCIMDLVSNEFETKK